MLYEHERMETAILQRLIDAASAGTSTRPPPRSTILAAWPERGQ